MKMGFDIEGASPAAPDYRLLRAVLEVRAFVERPPIRAFSDRDDIAACSFSRAGIARLLGLESSPENRRTERQGKDYLNLGGSIFGESGGVETICQPGDRADGGQGSVQGSYA